jgi:phage-related tail protein
MEFNLDIKPEQINKMVSEAVLNSAIGTAIKESIKRETSKLSSTYNNPIDDVINREIKSMARDFLLKDLDAEIRIKVNEAIKTRLTDDFITKLMNNMFDNLDQ